MRGGSNFNSWQRRGSIFPKMIHESVFVAEGAVITGDVTIGAESSVWYNAVLRGDMEPITIGAGTNI